jgi:hypothetical protein
MSGYQIERCPTGPPPDVNILWDVLPLKLANNLIIIQKIVLLGSDAKLAIPLEIMVSHSFHAIHPKKILWGTSAGLWSDESYVTLYGRKLLNNRFTIFGDLGETYVNQHRFPFAFRGWGAWSETTPRSS